MFAATRAVWPIALALAVGLKIRGQVKANCMQAFVQGLA